MPSQDPVDPVVAEADRRAERAKASLLERVELLKHKLTDARHKLDVTAQIAEHPWPAIGVAFALGVAAGFGRRSPEPVGKLAKLRHKEEPRTMRDIMLTAAVSLGMKVVRDAVLGQLADVAKQWWIQKTREMPASEARTGQRRDLEPFLER